MSSGSSAPSAPQPTSQTVNQSNIPAYARPYFERMIRRAEAASNQEYIPYEGPRIAGATADTQSAFEGARNLQNTYLQNQQCFVLYSIILM